MGKYSFLVVVLTICTLQGPGSALYFDKFLKDFCVMDCDLPMISQPDKFVCVAFFADKMSCFPGTGPTESPTMGTTGPPPQTTLKTESSATESITTITPTTITPSTTTPAATTKCVSDPATGVTCY